MKLMRKIMTALVSLALLVPAMPGAWAEELTGTIVYVSPTGNDANDGSEAAPLATMKGARDKVRQIKSAGMPANGITVVFRGGSYPWTEELQFTEEDSGTADGKIVYRSYPGEKAVFEGGIKIPGSEFTPVTNEDILMRWSNAKAKENIRQIDIKSYMAKNGYNNINDYYTQIYDTYHFAGTYQGTDQEAAEGKSTVIRRPIYSFDGEQALWLARYPNKSGGWYADTHPLTQFLKTGDVVKDGGATEPSTFKYTERRISKYEGYEDVYIFGHLYYLFYHDEAKVNINAADQTITTVAPLPLGVKSNMDFFIFNILDELDAPGEYYVDKNTGIMYVYPNGDISQKTLNVTLLDTNWMITTKDTSNVTFSGLSFENSKGSAIKIDGGENFRLEYCDFNNFGAQAVAIGDRTGLPYSNFGEMAWEDYNDTAAGDDWWQKQYNYWLQDDKQVEGKNHGLYGCRINNVGNAGVTIAGGNVYKNELSGHYIENCVIENVSMYKRTYGSAINLNVVHGVDIKNNRLGHTPAAIINGNTTVATIQGNELYDGMSESNDNGLIYLNYQYPNLDIKFIDNYFHDTTPEHEITSSTSMFSQRSGVAFDNSYGGGVEFENNVFVNIPRGTFIKTNDKFNNNVFVDCFTPLQVSEGVTDTAIVIPEELTRETIDPLFPYTRFFLGWPIFAGGEIGQKVQAEWRTNYPTVMEWVDILKSGEAGAQDYYEAKNNLIVNSSMPLHQAVMKLGEGTSPTYQNASRHEVTNNVYTQDTSMFVDYANRNYQLTPEASAKYGNTLDLSTVGPKIEMVGADKYAEAAVALPTAQGGTVTVPVTQTVPEQVRDAVVLRTNSANAFVNGQAAKIDSQNAAVMPQIIDGRTLVPARFIAESFGGEVGWDPDTRTVTIQLGGQTATMVLGDAKLLINGAEAAVMDVPAQVIEDRTMVPLRVLCETVLGKKVFWDDKGLIVVSDQDQILDSSQDAAVIDQIISMLK